MIPKRAIPYWQFVIDAAKAHGFEGHVYEFGAIIDRESFFGEFLKPPGPAGTGDGGHGRGLCQIDDRVHGQFITLTDEEGTPLWQKPKDNIDYGAAIFAECLHEMERYGVARLIAAIAAYNAGTARVHHALAEITQPSSYQNQLDALDFITTGGEAGPYVSDVLSRAARFLHKPEDLPWCS